MNNNHLTETEVMVLRHLLKFGNKKIEQFESLNLDLKTREFLIFDMMVAIQQKEQNKRPNKEERPKGFFRKG